MDRAREEDVGSTGLGEEEDGEEEDTTITMATEVEEVYVIWIYKDLFICYIYVIQYLNITVWTDVFFIAI